MELSIAIKNYTILQTLRDHEKLQILNNHVLSIDQRWIKSIRRTVSNDSKHDLINPIKLTFKTLIESKHYSSRDLHYTLEQVLTTFLTTYPTFKELHILIEDLMTENHNNYVKSVKSVKSLSVKVISVEDDFDNIVDFENSSDNDNTQQGCCVSLKVSLKEFWKRIKNRFKSHKSDRKTLASQEMIEINRINRINQIKRINALD